jgi:hypothetical protein
MLGLGDRANDVAEPSLGASSEVPGGDVEDPRTDRGEIILPRNVVVQALRRHGQRNTSG